MAFKARRRCVPRAFLCGPDSLTGKDCSSAASAADNRILFLGEVFCIDVAADSEINNCRQVMLHINMT